MFELKKTEGKARRGVGIGTIVAMFAVGKIISKCNGLFGDKIRTAAGMQQ